MSFQKVRIGKGFIIKLEIKDQDGSKLEEWTNMLVDFPKVYNIIKSKYGLIEETKVVKDKDLDWVLKR